MVSLRMRLLVGRHAPPPRWRLENSSGLTISTPSSRAFLAFPVPESGSSVSKKLVLADTLDDARPPREQPARRQ